MERVITEKRKEEILDGTLDYVSEHCDGAELIKALIDIIGMKEDELKFFGFEFSDEEWKEYREM